MNATKVEARPLRQRMLGVLLAPALVIGLAACDTQRGGFSADDAAAIRDQIEQVADRLDAVEQRLMDLSAEGEQNEPAQLISEVREVRDDVGEARNMLTEVSQQLADEQAEELQDQNDPLAPNDPFGAPANDPLVPPANDGLGAPNVGDDLNEFGNDVEQGLDDLGQDIDQGAQDLRNDLDDALDGDEVDPGGVNDPLNDGNDPAPLDDPLVPNPPDL